MIRHYLSIIFTYHPFQPSPIALLRVGNTFSISFYFDATKYQKTVLMSHRQADFHSQFNGHAYSYHLLLLWRWRLNFDLNGIERVIIHLSVPKKTIVTTPLSVNIFTGSPSFMGARGAHKRLYGCNYSYLRVQN